MKRLYQAHRMASTWSFNMILHSRTNGRRWRPLLRLSTKTASGECRGTLLGSCEGTPSALVRSIAALGGPCELTNNEHDNPRQDNYTQKHEHRVFAFFTPDFLKFGFG